MSGLSSRLAVGCHILVYLAWRRGGRAASQEIAGSVNTNPVVVRRMLGLLRDAGLVEVREGAAGGARLARGAAEITLLDVFRAVEAESLFAPPAQAPCEDCSVGANVQAALAPALREAQRSMEAALGGVTVEALRSEVAARDARCRGGAGPGGEMAMDDASGGVPGGGLERGRRRWQER